MAIVAARLLRDRERVLVGVGLPNLAANLAKRLHAPNLVMIYESGVIDAEPAGLPLSIGDPDLVRTSLCVLPMAQLFSEYLQTGWVDVGFLGGAQVDRRGNINSTVIGSYDHPTVRLAGSGGAADIASLSRRTVVLIPHQRERIPDQVDFVTAPGHPPGRRRPNGPSHVITDLGLLTFAPDGELTVAALHQGVDLQEVRDRTGFDIRVAPDLHVLPPPSAAELRAFSALTGAGG